MKTKKELKKLTLSELKELQEKKRNDLTMRLNDFKKEGEARREELMIIQSIINQNPKS